MYQILVFCSCNLNALSQAVLIVLYKYLLNAMLNFLHFLGTSTDFFSNNTLSSEADTSVHLPSIGFSDSHLPAKVIDVRSISFIFRLLLTDDYSDISDKRFL